MSSSDSSGRIVRRPRINVESLESARLVLLAHEAVLEETITANGGGPDDLDRVLEAIRHVIDKRSSPRIASTGRHK